MNFKVLYKTLQIYKKQIPLDFKLMADVTTTVRLCKDSEGLSLSWQKQAQLQQAKMKSILTLCVSSKYFWQASW